jgi:hypothetical protein
MNTDYGTHMQSKKVISVKKKKGNSLIVDGNSLGCFGPKNLVRLAVCNFVENPYFEYFILYLIGLNSLIMSIDQPILKDPYSKETIVMLVDFISLIFLLECLLKIFVLGFIMGKHSYLRDSFNQLDFIIVVFSCVSYVLERQENAPDLTYMKAFRALRALRPLKLVSKNEGMKNVVNSLLSSIPNLINVMLISLLFYFVFGIIGL